MIKKGAILIGVLVCGLAAAIFIIFNLNQTYRNNEKRHEREIEGLAKRLTVLSSARATLQQALRKSIRKKREYRESAAEYKNSLEEEIKRREVLDAELKNLSSLMATAKSEAQKLGGENSVLKTKLTQLEQDKASLDDRIAYFKRIQEKLQFKISRLLMRPKKIELGEVVVRPSGLDGKVLKANGLYNFVITDLGKNDGVKPGMTLMAYRQDNPIGEIIIEKVYDELSVGTASFEWLGDELSVGDTVRGKE